MRSFCIRYNYLILLVFIFLFAEVIIDPLREFPLNDDWSYTKSVKILHESGELNIGNWGAMTLVSHLLWGVLFTKTFGFSFLVLRCSTLVSTVIALIFFYKLVFKISNSNLLSFFAGLVLLFNPLYFNLNNTFMTDINFNTLLILFVYAAFRFFETKKLIYLPLLFFLSLLLLFLRQFGIIAPVAFAICCFFIREKKFLYVLLSLLLFAAVYLSLKFYEHSLQKYLATWSSYKFSDKVHITDPLFWKGIWINFQLRYKHILIYVLFFSFPFALLMLRRATKGLSKVNGLLYVFISGVIACLLCQNLTFPLGNVFNNMTLGPETFYENVRTGKTQHTSQDFEFLLNIFKYVFTAGTIFIILCSANKFRLQQVFEDASLKKMLILLLLAGYVIMLLISDSFFDRYHIPLIMLFILLLVFLSPALGKKLSWELIPILLLFYVSVAGTRDYLALNEARWTAYQSLLDDKIPTERINGGFEINFWNEGRLNWWYAVDDLQQFDYLIQFNAEPGFVFVREYPFTRFFPYKKDKINIFVREAK